jgi:hypothetical protein
VKSPFRHQLGETAPKRLTAIAADDRLHSENGRIYLPSYLMSCCGTEKNRVLVSLQTGRRTRRLLRPAEHCGRSSTRVGLTLSVGPWWDGTQPTAAFVTAEQAAASTATEEIRSVANFIVETDAAMSSYLSGAKVNMVGREPRGVT